MGMCAMYSFCKYEPRRMHGPNHELDGEAADVDSPRSSGTSSDGSCSMLGKRGKGGAERYNDQHPALWKRTIPKGRRCEPLDFSGLILYDEHGNRLHQFTPTSSYPSDRPSSLDA